MTPARCRLQWGYPHQNREEFLEQFRPISSARPSTKLAAGSIANLHISTLLFGDEQSKDPARPSTPWPHPFRQLHRARPDAGRRRPEDVQEQAELREPNEIFDRYGADAPAVVLLRNQPPWTSIRYSEQAIKESIPEFLLRLWNVYSFFVIYANIEASIRRSYSPADGGRGSRRAAAPRASRYRGSAGASPSRDRAGDLTDHVQQLSPRTSERAELSADCPAQRTRPLDLERTEPRGLGGDRANGRLRQLRRLCANHRVCRCL